MKSRASDRVWKKLGNCATFSGQIVRQERPIVWHIVRFSSANLTIFKVSEEANNFLLSARYNYVTLAGTRGTSTVKGENKARQYLGKR